LDGGSARRNSATYTEQHKYLIRAWDVVMWTGLVWLRIGTGGELL
jgi:hypothetical protein